MRPSRDGDPTHASYLRSRPALHDGYERTSRHLVMRDGNRIAIDVCLPRGLRAGDRVPAIVRQTRYFRRFRVHPWLRGVLDESLLDPMNAPMRHLFTSRGYAWIDVDARGSGASFGERPCPWWMEGEVADGAEVVDHVVKQPWSNGRVGATGVSYDGTCADFLAITRHPAVKAIAPRFCLFDVYADVAFPGGLHCAYFTEAWERANAALDRDAPGEMIALIYSLRAQAAGLENMVHRAIVQRAMKAFFTRALAGVAPIDGDASRALLAEAMRSHGKNYDVHEGAMQTTYRDDSPPNAPIVGQTSDGFSPHSYVDRMRDVAVLSYGGWYDGGYANAATKRHRALGDGARLLIGPWVHGGVLDLDPDAPGRKATFDHATEALRFFDRTLPDAKYAEKQADPRVRFYIMGEGRWRETDEWPPKGTRATSFHFARERKLTTRREDVGALDAHEVDTTTGAGKRTRWRTLLCPFLEADGKGRSPRGWLVYESAPHDRDLDVVGHPALVLRVASSAPDGAIVAFVEDVDARGEPRLFTEGVLRTVHRTRLGDDGRAEATFLRRDALRLAPGEWATHVIELLPTAMRLRRGHRLRLSLGGADVDTFLVPPAAGSIRWRIDLCASRLILPLA